MPTAHIVAGADASGKTTLVSSLYQGGYFNTEKYVGMELIILKEHVRCKNIFDVLADEDTDDYYFTDKDYAKATVIAHKLIEQLVEAKEDFVTEMTMAYDIDIDFIKSLKDHGYHVIVYYIGVENDVTSAEYMIKRIKNGGRDISIRKLLNEKKKSIQQTSKIIGLADIAVMIDNSLSNIPPTIVSIYEQRCETYFLPEDKPNGRHTTWDSSFNHKMWRSDEEKPGADKLIDAKTEDSNRIKIKLERIFNYLFLHTVQLSSIDWLEVFMEEDDKGSVRAILTYSSNTGLFYGNCNRPGYMTFGSNVKWNGMFGSDDCFHTSDIADYTMADGTLTINTLNSVYVFEILKGELDTSKIVLAPEDIIKEYKSRNEAKYLTYWCQVSGNVIVNNAIDWVTMPYPMNRLEAVEYISVVPTMSFGGDMAKNILMAHQTKEEV